MAKHFNNTEWGRINTTLKKSLETEREPFGLPEERKKSVLLGTFNIRELGAVKNRSRQSWEFLKLICSRFDLVAIQEVQDELEGIRHLHELLGGDYGMVVSDTTGKTPGSSSGSAERLAFLFRWNRIQRTELASDISYDRSAVVNTLLENRLDFNRTLLAYEKEVAAWKKENEHRKKQGKRAKSKPVLELPHFLTFIRQPHCASFKVIPKNRKAKPYEFLLVNAHLLYGTNKQERRWEFDALIEWLAMRAKMRDEASFENIIMMGDCNFEFEDANVTRADMDARLKTLNSTQLKGKEAAKVNFPLLDPHSTRGLIRTNARQDQTYDQIAIFVHDKRLPDYTKNATAGSLRDGYDYGAFRFTDLFAKAFFGKDDFDTLTLNNQNFIIDRVEWDISDHMPAWFRLPLPSV